MLNKAIGATLLLAATLQGSSMLDRSVLGSASRTANGSGQVTSRRISASSQFFTSEAGYPAVLVPGVTSHTASASLASLPLTTETWQSMLACLAMAVFALFAIRRRIRHSHTLDESRRR